MTGLDIKWGPASFGLLLTPIANIVLAGVMASVELLEENIENDDFDDLAANAAVGAFADKIADKLVPIVQAELRDAAQNAKIDPRQNLVDVCQRLDPGVPQSHPYHFFYRYLKWHCDGFAASHTLRPFQKNAASEEDGCYADGAYVTPDDAGKSRWWGRYIGQQWAFPFVPDSGCRVSATMASTLDKDMWPTLTCATMTFNAWLNNGPQPAGASLQTMIANTCSGFGLDALQAYYGNGADLIDLYQDVHADDPVGDMKN